MRVTAPGSIPLHYRLCYASHWLYRSPFWILRPIGLWHMHLYCARSQWVTTGYELPLELSSIINLHLAVKLDGLNTIFSAVRAGFFLLMWPLHIILLGIFPEFFTLCHRVPGAMHQAYFVIGCTIDLMACMFFFALTSSARLGVGCRGGYSSITFTAMTGSVIFCHGGIFIRFSSFVYLLHNIHELEHVSCLLVGLPLKIPAV